MVTGITNHINNLVGLLSHMIQTFCKLVISSALQVFRMKDTDGEDKEDRNVFKLLSQLRKEKLFITNEKLNIQKLNKAVCSGLSRFTLNTLNF